MIESFVTGVLFGLSYYFTYRFGVGVGRLHERLSIQRGVTRVTESYNKIIKLAELNGEDTTKLSNEEIARRIKKYEDSIKDTDVPY